MNKQSTAKLALLMTGLAERLSSNTEYFKKMTVSFKSGTKSYTALVKYDGTDFIMNFNGVNEIIEPSAIPEKISGIASSYDTVNVIYEERGTTYKIDADNKNVKLFTSEADKENVTDEHAGLGFVTGGREYLIKPGKADALLREIGILGENGKIKNDMVRKYSQTDHFVELLDSLLRSLAGKEGSINVIDCGCGKSYLSFVLNFYIREVLKKACHFTGLDYSKDVIESSRKMASNLGYSNMEFEATDIRNYTAKSRVDMVISLHACDTATDEAIALAVNNRASAIVCVPCCHREILSQYSYKPFEPVIKHGILKARMADVLTDGLRSLFLEAAGYKVSMVEYVSPLDTPKNLMLRAEKGGSGNSRAMEEYRQLTSALGVNPTLAKLVNI